MKSYNYFTSFILMFSLIVSAQTNNKKQFNVSGKVTQTFSYCGGIAPSQEMLEKLKIPQPYIGKVFYIRKGKFNDLKQATVLKIVVDSSGSFSFSLQPGIYSFIQSEQLKAINYNTFSNLQYINCDKACLLDWWKKPYFQFEIKDKPIEGLSFNFFHSCFVSSDIPCLQYIGPMPP